jgi:hypothetical protein
LAYFTFTFLLLLQSEQAFFFTLRTRTYQVPFFSFLTEVLTVWCFLIFTVLALAVLLASCLFGCLLGGFGVCSEIGLELGLNELPDLGCHQVLEVVDASFLVFLGLELLVDAFPAAALTVVHLVEVVEGVALGVFCLDLVDFSGKTACMGSVVGTGGDALLPLGGRERLVLRNLRHCCGGEADESCHE